MSPVIPDWLPLWGQMLLLTVLAVSGVAFLLMPFAVFGLKGRLSEIELQLADVRADLRVIAMRLGSVAPEPAGRNAVTAAVSVTPEEWVPSAKPESMAAEPQFRPVAKRQTETQQNPSPSVPRADAPAAASRSDDRDEDGYFFPPSAKTEKPETEKSPGISPDRPVADRHTTEKTGSGDVARSGDDLSARVTYGFSTVPRVSDAYEPEQNILPELRASRQNRATREENTRPDHDQPQQGRRMPWHEPPDENIGRRGTDDGRPSGERTEPVLRWPSRRPD
ncbi:hypothetical protein GOB93_13305 [Acetobacter musti]|uniref:Uncharacterized protein n=1 Tax=Acetobacter musti TaxID=864732 RepID=A0ABX0JUG0_9PROT|nr:hypothetical protein [Acetobacter musti]NHN85610.1 hypothetical protein [Acetobacter musti]